MTLLASVAGVGFALSCSDTRISVKSRHGFKSVDEKFNEHIIFHSAGLTAKISYTGFAQSTEAGRTVRMYDVISESLTRSVQKSLAFAPLVKDLPEDVLARLAKARLADLLKDMAWNSSASGGRCAGVDERKTSDRARQGEFVCHS